jgi:hypothetical protein
MNRDGRGSSHSITMERWLGSHFSLKHKKYRHFFFASKSITSNKSVFISMSLSLSFSLKTPMGTQTDQMKKFSYKRGSPRIIPGGSSGFSPNQSQICTHIALHGIRHNKKNHAITFNTSLHPISSIMVIKSICVIICIGLFSLISVCSADESPGYKILLEGGESILTENEDGSMTITIQSVIPYAAILDDPEYITLLEMVLPDTNTAMNAGVIFSNPDGDTTSFVQVSHPDYSAETMNLTFVIQPLEYYEGSILADLKEQSESLNPDIARKAHATRIFLEKGLPVSENYGGNDRCMDNCERYNEKSTRIFCEMNCMI